ncbi:MAG: hypothetical protein COW55_15375 [Rhodobacteraceae bacterium CG17_big_fil_post_rev_8_21_14_2_50_65_11]|nr:MAG: hypothetical protein COW55_15375 [Rhodobacteraceae bacterium CG17_big_fil_post_rev_8_21_14_2_50_65_11]
MIFETREEVDVPRDFAFWRFADFTRYEQAARGYGAEIRRVNGFTEMTEGVSWRGSVVVRGKTRGVEATVTVLNPPERAQMQTVVGGMRVDVDLTFEELAPEKTLVRASAQLKATTLGARLILQTVKLARKKVQGKIDSRIVALGNQFENDYRRQQRRG